MSAGLVLLATWGLFSLGKLVKKSNSPGIWDIIIFTITHPILEAETCRTGPGAGGAVGIREAPTQTGLFRADTASTGARNTTGGLPRFFPFPECIFEEDSSRSHNFPKNFPWSVGEDWNSCSESRGVSLSRSLGIWLLGRIVDAACPSGCARWNRSPIPDPVPQEGVVRIDPVPQDVPIGIGAQSLIPLLRPCLLGLIAPLRMCLLGSIFPIPDPRSRP